MANDFHEIQFPTDISYGSQGGPEFSTEIVQLGSGHEQRNQNWTYSRERWNVAYGVTTADLLAALIDFFYARKGRAIGFRFKNHDDYQGTDEELGDGDGSTVDFQLVKVYGTGSETYTRKISKPITGTVTIYVDGTPEGGVTIDYETGIVTFSVAPSSGEVVTATFEFDVPARFDVDHLPVNLDTYEARSADVPIVELML